MRLANTRQDGINFMKNALLKLIAIAAMPLAGISAAQAQTPQAQPALVHLPKVNPPKVNLPKLNPLNQSGLSECSVNLSHHAIRLLPSELRRSLGRGG
jgi:hypothetical protein